MQVLRCLLSLSLFTLAARAIHESEVGIVDWHTKLVGVPRYNSQLTAPVFRDDIVLTATGNNVLAALNATDGNIVWRSIYDAEDPIIGFKVHDDSIYTLSGPGGSTLRTFDISTGDLVLEKRLHNPIEGKLHDPPSLGVAIALIGGQDGGRAFTLANADTARCIHPNTGEVLWEWRSPDQGSLVMYTHIYPDTHTSTLYLAGFAKSVASYTLHVTTLDFVTGEVIASVHIPGNIANVLTDFFLVGPMRAAPSVESTTGTRSDEPGPSLVWLTPSSTSAPTPLSLYSAPLSPSLKGKVLTIPNSAYKRIVDVGLANNGLVMAFLDNGAAEVISYEKSGLGMGKIWDFGDVTASQTASPSHFIGALNEKGEPRIGRVYWSNAHNQVIHQTFEANLDEGTGTVTSFAIPFETHEHGTIRHVTFAPASSSAVANETTHKILLVTSTGSLQLWAHDSLQWVREESLATVKTASFIELPSAREHVIGGTAISGTEGFWSKVARQIGDAKNLPHYIVHFVTRFVTGSYASPSSPVSPPPSSDSTALGVPHSYPPRLPASTTTTLVRDPFSFRQLLIVSTAYGKLFALDSSTGAIVWSRVFGLGWADKVGGQIIPLKMFVVHGSETGSDGREGLALVTQRKADNGLVDTVIFHFDPLTGEDIKIVTPKEGESASPRKNVKDVSGKWVSSLDGVDVIAGPVIEVFSVPDGKDTIGMLDEFLQVQLYPDTPTTRAALTSLGPKFHLALRAGTEVLGHQLGFNDEVSSFHVAYPTWGVSFGGDETVISIIRSSNKGREAASIGRVKGDRSTLYKYLNNHMTIVLTGPSSTSSTSTSTSGGCGLYVIDTVKGTVLYHASLPAVDGKCGDVQAVLDENWLVYSYYDDGMEIGGAKSYRVVSVEMYEGYAPDEKISSPDISSYSNETTEFSVYERAFVVPYAITSIATTTTKFGVSTKDIIVSSRKHSVHSIPRHLLNPRRPKSKPTSQEAEEMLMQYEPVLPDDGRLVLSHYYEVADVRQIVTAPSLLESTSLVLAIGTDLFLTRISTSGTFDVLSENFNKVQLVLTVVGLAVAIGVTKPMVGRKKLRERWYQ